MKKLCAVILFFFLFGFAPAQTFTNSTGGNIPDGGSTFTCFPITVTGVGTIGSSYGLVSVCLNINHTYDGDLFIYLRAPDNTTIILSNQNGGSNNNYTGTCFTMTAATQIQNGVAPFTGTFRPEENLGFVNNGQNANGVWQLCIRDVVLGDAGSLLNWSLTFGNSPAPPPPPTPPCNGNDPASNNCETATHICSFSGYCGNTDSTYYNPDYWPALGGYYTNIGAFCGSIENNSFVSFIATATTASFSVTVSNSTQNLGIQMFFFEGACGGPITGHGCYSPINPNATSTVQATGLTPGNQYYLMIDGFAGDVCDYSIQPVAGVFTLNVTSPNFGTGNSATICKGSSITLNATPAGGVTATNYHWVSSDSSVTSSSSSITVSPTTTTIYTATADITGGNSNFCTGTISGQFTVNVVELSGDTTAVTCNNFTWHGVTYTATPSIAPTYIYQSVAGCDSMVILHLTINQPPVPPAVHDTSYCLNDLPVRLTAGIVGASSNFSFTEGFENQTFPPSGWTRINAGSGNNWTRGANTCTGTGSLYYYYNALNAANAWMLSPSQYLMAGVTYTISFNYKSSGTSYPEKLKLTVGNTNGVASQTTTLWQNGSITNTGCNTATVTFTPTVCGNFYFGLNCYSAANMYYLVVDNFSITGTVAPVLNWYTQASGGTPLSTAPIPSTNAAGSTTYYVSQSLSCCEGPRVPVVVTVKPLPDTPAVVTPVIYCKGAASVQLTAQGSGLLWYSNASGGAGSASAPIPSTGAAGTVIYYVSQTVGGCQSPRSSISVIVNDSITPLFGQIAPVCRGTLFTLPLTSTNNINGSWSPVFDTLRTQTYTFTPSNTSGLCTRKANMTVVIKQPSSSLISPSVCANALPYAWNGQSYTSAGAYTYRTVNVAGCDSIAILNLTVKNTSSSITSFTTCASALPFIWNGRTYNSSAIDSIRLVNANSVNCDSVAYLKLTVSTYTNSDTAVSICALSAPFVWNGQSYSASGVYTYHTFNAANCDSFAILHFTVNNPSFSTKKDTVCSNLLPYSWNGNNYSSSGLYTVHFTNAAGCDSAANLNLVVKQTTSSFDTVSVCSQYIWNGQTYSASGNYASSFINAVGCDSVANLCLTIRYPTSSVTNADTCNSFVWNGTTYTTTGFYPVHFTNAAGCDSTATLNLTIRRSAVSTTTVDTCDSFVWNGTNYTTTGFYSVHFTNAVGCDSTATLNLTIRRSAVSTTTVDTCDSYLWNGTTYTTTGFYPVHFTNAAGCDSTATLNLTIRRSAVSTTTVDTCNSYVWNGTTYTTTGFYPVHFMNAAGCDSTANLNLTIRRSTVSTKTVDTCDSYIWNGITYTTTGFYSVHFTNAAGCDSTATLNLTIRRSAFSTTTVDTCDSYLWNGTTYTTTGFYSVHFINAAGCDSLATLQLTIRHRTFGFDSVIVCSSSLPFIWNGQSISLSGNYTAHFANAAGCDSTANLNLGINNYSTSNADTSFCASQFPVSWNGMLVAGVGNYKDTLIGASGCDSIITWHVSLKNTTTGLTNRSICLSQLPYSWHGQSCNAAGTYTAHLTNAVGCDSADILVLTVNSFTSSTIDTSVCRSSLPFLWNNIFCNASATYRDTLVGSAGCDSVVILNLTVTSNTFSAITQSSCGAFTWNGSVYSVGGTYTHNYFNADNCPSTDTLHLTISNGVPNIDTVNVCDSFRWNDITYTIGGTYVFQYPPNSVCLTADTLRLTIRFGTFSVLEANNCDSYAWNGTVYTGSGNYIRNYLNASGCPSADTLKLQIDPTPPAPTVVSPVSYCQREAALPLTASGIGQILWYSSPSGGTGINQAPVPSTSNLSTSFYYVSQVFGNCEGPRVPVVVRINPKPSLGIDRDIHLCFGRELNLDALYNTDDLSAIWVLNQQIVSNPSGVNEPGVYYLYAVNSAGCKDTAKVQLSLQPPLTANAGPDDTTDFMTPYRLNGSGGGTYLWTPGVPLLNNPYISSPVAVLNQTTPFILMVQDDIGCSDYDTVVIYVRLGDDFYVPNAFTPNGDGLNDYFSPVPLGGIAELEYFRIFNRWGQQVFVMSSSNGFAYTNLSSRGWDGKYLGRPQDPGNYVWELKGKNRRGEAKFLKGNVILIR